MSLDALFDPSEGASTSAISNRAPSRSPSHRQDQTAISDSPFPTIHLRFGMGDKDFLVSVHPNQMEAVKNIIQQLSDLYGLEKNWDSYGSREISQVSIENSFCIALNALTQTSNLPKIAPLSSGGVSIEWLQGTKEIEIEILDDEASILVSEGDRHILERETSFATARALLQKWLKG